MLPKLIVSDLDQTLLRNDKSISGYTLDVLRRCQRKGILFAVATARFRCDTIAILDLLQPDYEIFAEGAITYQNGIFLHGTPFTREQTRGIMDAILRHAPGCDIAATSHDRAFYCGTAPTWPAEPFAAEHADTVPIYKIGCSVSSYETAEKIALEHGCQFKGYRGENWFSFLPAGAGKMPAVSRLAEHLDITPADVWAFGDDMGDLDMLRGCGRGIAVANAVPQVLAAADEVTLSNEEDGLAACLEAKCLYPIG